MIPGGDYVSSGDGTRDCDGHGTQVAGIAAAKPSASDGFAGVAPDAQVIAIRQTSDSFTPQDNRDQGSEGQQTESGYGNVVTLGRAVMRAVQLGATVINISEVACTPAGVPLRDQSLGAAIRYAFQRGVVVVAATGNVDEGNPTCKTQNPGSSGGRVPDPWGSVVTQSSPAYFQPYVVAVGSVDPDGQPSSFSLAGPWVTVAAPGTQQISLNTSVNPMVIDGTEVQGQVGSIGGTSFAAPYVSGLAALIKARFPDLSAAQVINRITRTAHHPSDGWDESVGYGVIDPVAALTTTTPDTTSADATDGVDPRTGDTRNIYASAPIAPPSNPDDSNATVRAVAIGVSLGMLGFAVIGWVLIRRRTHDRRKLREGVDY
ncbi:type VII secretion-associated serine protease mycosin [Williamsia sp. SKLECPSW1]